MAGRRLLATVIDSSSDLRLEAISRDDAIHKTMFHQKLAGLETFGQFHTNGGFDGAGASEANQCLGFSKDQVPQGGETGSHTPHGRVGEYGNEQAATFVIAGQGWGYSPVNKSSLAKFPAGWLAKQQTLRASVVFV